MNCMTPSTIVVISGGFDPLHTGHLNYIRAAKQLGDPISDTLVVGVNSDQWLMRKKGRYFLPLRERTAIMASLRGVDMVFTFSDDDDTALDLLRQVRATWPDHPIIVANGGDRTPLNNAEAAFEDDNCEFVYGVGGTEKTNSSSAILKRWSDHS